MNIEKNFVTASGSSYEKNGRFPQGKGKRPVLNLFRDDPLAYCKWYGKKYPGWSFLLPTEAEWKNAAAGPKKLEYPWGNDAGFRLVNGVMQSRFNFNGVAAAYYLKKSPDLTVTYYHPKTSRHGKKEKRSTVISFGGRSAIRGGSWYANATSCRTTYRGEGRRSAGAYSTVGFRLAADEK